MQSASFFKSVLICAALALACLSSHAGQECGEQAAASEALAAKGVALGVRVRDQLERSGASAALIARVGLDLSEFGQRYTHLGVAIRDHVRQQWLVLHLYNPCGKGESELFTQGAEKFYETNLFAFDALIVTPSYANQARIRNTFLHPASAKQLHERAYNLIAHPYSTQFQNSNQWILEMLALALDDSGQIKNRTTAQRWLRTNGFVPAGVAIPNLRRSMARVFSPNVSFADHSQEEYEKQSYQVVTVDSIVQFLKRRDAALTVETLR